MYGPAAAFYARLREHASRIFCFVMFCRKNKETTSGLEPLTCSLRVRKRVLQRFALAWKSRIL